MKSPICPRRFRPAVALALGLILLPVTALAQDEGGAEGKRGGGGDESGIIYRKKTIVSFEDDTLEGNLMKPDGEYLEARKRVRHSNLIRIRENFKEKILESISSI